MKVILLLLLVIPAITFTSYYTLIAASSKKGTTKHSAIPLPTTKGNTLAPENQWQTYHQAFSNYTDSIAKHPPLELEFKSQLAEFISENTQTQISPDSLQGNTPEEILSNAEKTLKSSLESKYARKLSEAATDSTLISLNYKETQKARFNEASKKIILRYRATLTQYFKLSQNNNNYLSPVISRKDIVNTIPMPSAWEAELETLKPDDSVLRREAEQAAEQSMRNIGITPPRKPAPPVQGAGDNTGYQIALEEYQRRQLPIYQNALTSYQNTRNNIINQELRKLKTKSSQSAEIRNKYLAKTTTKLPQKEWDFYLEQIKRVLMPSWDVTYVINDDQSRQLKFQF